MVFLNKDSEFPHPKRANEDGIVAVGGELTPDRLLKAYRMGIFPWFEQNSPILWWSPDPRMVLFPKALKISKSMKKMLRNKNFEVTYNKDFYKVITTCSGIKRKGQSGTWITSNMIEAYCKLFEMGFAKSVEVWYEEKMVGGLYGIDLGNVFCGESMFSKMNNASKYGFIHLVRKLADKKYKLIDCQVYTSHLESLGAEEITRKEFLEFLK